MADLRFLDEPQAALDIESAIEWYETERQGLGLEFAEELRAAYQRIAEGPRKYQVLRSGIRRAWLRRFPYAVFFACEEDVVVVVAVLHAGRDPEEWQRRMVETPASE